MGVTNVDVDNTVEWCAQRNPKELRLRERSKIALKESPKNYPQVLFNSTQQRGLR